MPFYIVNGLPMHIRFSGRGKPPAPCAALVRRDGSEQRCCDISAFLCDWPTDGRRTCDLPLCNAHAREVGRNRHYCPAHCAEQASLVAQRDLFTGLRAQEPDR